MVMVMVMVMMERAEMIATVQLNSNESNIVNSLLKVFKLNVLAKIKKGKNNEY